MKKILIMLIPLSLFASNEERIQNLETRVKSLQKKMQYHQEDLDERMPIIEGVEKKAILDKINFSPELILHFDKVDYTNNSIKGENTKIYHHNNPSYIGLQRRDEYSKHFEPTPFIKAKFNMHANIDQNAKFYGRIVFSKSSQSNQRLCILSRDIKSAESKSAFDIDRAYIDFSPNKYSDYAFTFSFGLLPTSNGTPMQYAQNTTRKSMFPALVFDMNTYGIIATQEIAKETYMRGIIAKAYTMEASYYPYQCNRENIDNANVIGFYSDTKFKFLGTSLLSFGVNMLHNLKAHPYLGPDVTSVNAHVLGNILTFGAGIDIEKINNTNLTFFAHTALSNPHPNGNIDDYQIVATVNQTLEDGLTKNGTVGFSEASYAKGTMIHSNGYAIYLGTKYNLKNNFLVGAEYNYGSKYWFSATQGAEDMYNKLATRGHVGELYAMWKFHKNLYSKIGLIYTKENFTGSGVHFGKPVQKDAIQKVSYLTLQAKF